MTTYLGKSCSFGLPRVPFLNCRQFMYLVISLLVLRAGCGIWLYQFLIIAYLFTLLQSLIQKVLNQKERLYCAFVYLQKAFDSLYLNVLWFKLYKLGIDVKLRRIIRDMYDRVKSCVRHCNSFSEFFECSVGLRQGEVISPVMLSMFLERTWKCFLQDSCLNIDEITILLLLVCWWYGNSREITK